MEVGQNDCLCEPGLAAACEIARAAAADEGKRRRIDCAARRSGHLFNFQDTRAHGNCKETDDEGTHQEGRTHEEARQGRRAHARVRGLTRTIARGDAASAEAK